MLITPKSLIFIVFWLGFSAAVANACTCDLRPPVCTEYLETDDIFVGSITKVYRPEDSVQEAVTVKVEEAFRGIGFPIAQTYNYGHSCAFTFAEGSTYLFYAGHAKDKPNHFGTSYCSRTVQKDDPRFVADLDFLRAVKAGDSLYWIWGTLAEVGRDLPFAGIRASVLNQKKKIEGVSIEGVSNEFGDVKLEVPGPGEYLVRVHLPPKTRDFNASIPNELKRWERQRKQVVGAKLSGKNRYVDYKVDVAANRCGWFDLSISRPEKN